MGGGAKVATQARPLFRRLGRCGLQTRAALRQCGAARGGCGISARWKLSAALLLLLLLFLCQLSAAECPAFVRVDLRPHHLSIPSHLATATRRATTTAPPSHSPGAPRRARKQRGPPRVHCAPSNSARFLLCVPRALCRHLEG
jgi:hypothetical protein